MTKTDIITIRNDAAKSWDSESFHKITAIADYELKSGSTMLGENVKWYYDSALPITVGRRKIHI